MATRGRKKAKKNDHGGEEKDRLSDLPDAILLQILSNLRDTRQCVRTSILCKRWNFLWASLPDLTFWRAGFRDASAFKNFVLGVLSRRDNLPLTKFDFDYYGKDKSIITKTIKYAVSHNVQDFSVFFKFASFSHLYPHLHNCRSLKTLNLYSVISLHLLEDLTFPCLTTLLLRGCIFWDNGAPTSIDPFVGLVNLKSLQLQYCNMRGLNNFKISGPQLDSLDIRMDDRHLCKVETFAPKLRFFSFRKPDHFNMLSNLDFPLLEMADISTSLWLDRDDAPEEFFRNSFLHLFNVFCGVYHVQSLVLYAPIIKGLLKYPGLLKDHHASPFVRLKTLKVRYCLDSSSTFNIPDNVLNYFGENVTVENIFSREIF